MVKPVAEVNNKEYFKDIFFLYEIISRLKNKEEIKKFLKDLLTVSELRMIKRRWHIACLLEAELPVRTVAKQTGTGTNTVIKIADKLENGYGGLKVALERTKSERAKRKKLHQGLSATFGPYAYLKND